MLSNLKISRQELLLASFRNGYLEYLGLSEKQQQAMEILTDTSTEALVFGGGANGGKSWLGCSWLIYAAMAYPGTRWFIGREELKRLRESTLQTFYKVAKSLALDRTTFKYNGQDHYIQFANGSRIDLLELKYLPSDPLYERYGSVEYTSGWIEEGGEVAFDAYDTLKSRVGRHLNDQYGLMRKILITCNPKKNWLYTDFYKPFRAGELKATLRFLQSLVTDNPNRESGAIEALQGIKNKAKKERLLLGNWEYDDDPAQLMDYESITDLFTNDHVLPGKPYITADIARKGDDKTVLMVWSGFRVEQVLQLKGALTNETAERIKALQRQYGVPASHTVIDEDGVGGGVMDQVRGSKGFINNSTPLPVNGKPANYDNLKSQCYFALADKVNEGALYVKCTTDVQELLTEELEVIKEKDLDKDNKLAVIPKPKMKELLSRSPDFADALMMRMVYELGPPVKRMKAKTLKSR
jgi:phage terminase large subunit